MVARTRFLAAFLAAALLTAPNSASAQWSDPDFYSIQWRLQPNPACVEQDVTVEFRACRCNVELLEVGTSPIEGVFVDARVRLDVVCVQCDPDTLTVSLGKLLAGQHSIIVTAHATVLLSDSTEFEAIRRDTLLLTVSPICPPPPPGNPPMVERVHIGLGAPCADCPARACTGDSIPVQLSGYTFDACTDFIGVEVIPSLLPVYPSVPSLRVHFETASCLGAPCPLVATPWSATVKIPPLPIRLDPPYSLLVESDLADICLDGPPVPLGGAHFPFVVDACSLSAPPCFVHDLSGSGGPGLCEAVITEGTPAQIQMAIATQTPLAGLQGDLRFYPPGLRVSSMRPVGAAAGMQLQWTETKEGAEFVLFSLGDERIPASDPLQLFSVLEVEVSAVAGTAIPEYTDLLAVTLLASDEAGRTVPSCPTRDTKAIAPFARICRASLCDMNGDGGADVRDLVLLVRCIREEGPCPELSPSEPTDCDRDGEWDLDDVFCCAHVVLSGDRPDSTTGTPDPGVAVSLGAPRDFGEGELVVPVRVQGADRLGAARLQLQYPADRYEEAEVIFPENGANWLALSETTGERVALGFIDLQAGDATGPDELGAEVRLRLRPGQAHGGELILQESEFTGLEGTALWQGEDTPAVPLAPFAGVRLSAPRPNPFQNAVHFSVQLAQAASVDVTVYDATGRLVAQLYRGYAQPGAFDLAWKGRTSDGFLAPSGVYWLRATAAGVTTTQKVLYLRNP